MNKSVEKFKEYLDKLLQTSIIMIQEDYIKTSRNLINKKIPFFVATVLASDDVIDQYQQNGFLKQMTLVRNIIEELELPKDNWKDSMVKFTDFDKLSVILESSNLTSHEMFDVVKYMLEKNLRYSSEDAQTVEYKEIKRFKIPSMTEKEFQEFIVGKEFIRVVNAPYKELSDEELTLRYQIDEYLLKSKNKNSNMIAQKIIKRHYFNKDAFNEKDIKIICKALKCIGISSKLCEAFQYLLIKELKGKQKQKTNRIVRKEEKVKEKLSQKEYDKIFREIEKYYDIQNHRVIKPLLLEEIIYMISLMYKINIAESEIIKSIQMINKEGLDAYGNNSIGQFNAYYAKMLSCSDNPDIANAIQTILGYLQEMYIPSTSSDYSFWKDGIQDELKAVIPILNKDYQYELDAGKKL